MIGGWEFTGGGAVFFQISVFIVVQATIKGNGALSTVTNGLKRAGGRTDGV